ncbi:hypothetical protein DSUL_100028 [Desulfovibrionales bacterium]
MIVGVQMMQLFDQFNSSFNLASVLAINQAFLM